MKPIKIFGLNATSEYAKKVARQLNVELTPHEERLFDDQEVYVKPVSETELGNVRGHDVFVIQSLYSDEKESVNDKFIKLCMMISSLKDASAYRITAIIPHLAYSRQDRKTESRAPVTTKMIASMLEVSGLSRCLFFDVHNLSAEQNAFKIPVDNLEAKNLFIKALMPSLIDKKITVLSPDAGGYARASRFRNSLQKKVGGEIELAILDKLRTKERLSGGRIIGEVKDRHVIIIDDLISTGSTMTKAGEAIEKAGGQLLAICATHGLFVGKANENFQNLKCQILVTDTVSPYRLNEENLQKLHIVPTVEMVAWAVDRINSGTGSISSLLR